MNKASLGALAVLVAVAAVVIGCGSSDGGETSTETLTKVEFVKQADAICEKGTEENQAEFEEFAEENGLSEKKEPTKAQQEEAVTEIVAPGVQKQIEEIDALDAPEGDEEQIEAMVAAVEEGVKEIEENPAALTEGKNPLAEGSKLAKEYGLKACGEE